MATIVPRKLAKGKIGYRALIRMKGFDPVSKEFDLKTDAKEWARRTEREMKEGKVFPERAARKRTLTDLIDRYVEQLVDVETTDGRKRAAHLELWKVELGDCTLAEITPSMIAEARDNMATRTLKSGARVKGATTNRYLSALGAVMKVATRDWGWVQENPMTRVSKKRESQGRLPRLSDADRQKLLDACSHARAPYLYPAVVLALCTGMRQGEILGLRWSDIDFDRWCITLTKTKNGDRRFVPLGAPAKAVIEKLAAVVHQPDDLVLLGTGSFRAAYGRAVKRAGLSMTFHDLRHIAASYLAQLGRSPSEIAHFLGHRTLSMVKRYAHLWDEHTATMVRHMNETFLGHLAGSSRSAAVGDERKPVLPEERAVRQPIHAPIEDMIPG